MEETPTQGVRCVTCSKPIEPVAPVVQAAHQVTTTNDYGEQITVDGSYAYFHDACWVSDNNAEGWLERRRGTLRAIRGY